MAFQGGCLCGAVRYEGQAHAGGGHCRCVHCRKTSGTGHGSHMVVPKDAFSCEGDVKFFESEAESGHKVQRGFCPTCGSQIYSTNNGFEDLVFVRASSLDDPEVFEPQMIVYTSRRPSWNKIDADLPSFEVMPPFEGMPEM